MLDIFQKDGGATYLMKDKWEGKIRTKKGNEGNIRGRGVSGPPPGGGEEMRCSWLNNVVMSLLILLSLGTNCFQAFNEFTKHNS